MSYGCDPRKVRATLLKVAQANPDVTTTPAPSVDFDFGADTLNFKLYAFVDDLNKGGSTSTDLRFAILDAFNEAGIAIPFRQTDATPAKYGLVALMSRTRGRRRSDGEGMVKNER